MGLPGYHFACASSDLFAAGLAFIATSSILWGYLAGYVVLGIHPLSDFQATTGLRSSERFATGSPGPDTTCVPWECGYRTGVRSWGVSAMSACGALQPAKRH